MTNLKLENLRLKAIGLGGIESCYILLDFGIAFDFGRCPEELIDIDRIFLTHGHLDHASGLPYYFSQRSLKHRLPGQVYVPYPLYEPLKQILKLWHEIEDFSYEINLIPLREYEKVEIQKNYYILAIPAKHRIFAYGYVLIKEVQKLKKEYIGLPGTKIKELKEQNSPIFEVLEIPLFCFSGDTTIEFVLEHPIVQEAEILLLECTYIDEVRPVARAREWGHIHLDEIVSHAHVFKNKKLVLTHFSKRYSRKKIQEIVEKKLPQELKERVVLLTAPFE